MKTAAVVSKWQGEPASGLEVTLDGEKLLDVMRAAAGTDPTPRIRAMTKLLGCEQKAIGAALLQALRSISEGKRTVLETLMAPHSGFVDVLAILAVSEANGGAGSMLVKAYAEEPWLQLPPRIFAPLWHWLGINTAREMFETKKSLRTHGDRRDLEARNRAMDLCEACEPFPGAPIDGEYLELVREFLPREKDQALRERMAAFVTRCEATARQRQLVESKPAKRGTAAPRPRPKGRKRRVRR